MILIYGKGKVGNGVARLCRHLGLSYEIRDDSDAPKSYDQYTEIIPSPGIAPTHPIYATGKVVAELDFAHAYLPDDFVTCSVTGTDGKSTTSWILYSILEKEFSGKKSVYLSGNFDTPLSETVCQILEKGEKRGYIVIEISSFMSYGIKSFSTDYSLYTNIKPDHLNWHRDLEDYYDAKMRLIRHTTKKAIVASQVLEFGNEYGFDVSPLRDARIFALSTDKKYRDRSDGEDIIIRGRKKYKLSETQFSGAHNAMNILGSTLVTNEMDICSKRTKVYLTSIGGLPHRLEKIGEKNSITIVEDSKSTSSQSLEAALGSYGNTKNLLLIVGGSDKGDHFSHLTSQFKKRVKAMVAIGATKDQFIEIAQSENIKFLATDSLETGVKWLYEKGKKGDVLMLSPGCASFGLFRDYLDRATQFRDITKKLPE